MIKCPGIVGFVCMCVLAFESLLIVAGVFGTDGVQVGPIDAALVVVPMLMLWRACVRQMDAAEGNPS